MADEITVMATYSIPTALIEHWIEVWRCTKEYAIRAIIRTNEPSTIREMTYEDTVWNKYRSINNG